MPSFELYFKEEYLFGGTQKKIEDVKKICVDGEDKVTYVKPLKILLGT